MSPCRLRVTPCPVCGHAMLGGEYTAAGVRTYHSATPAGPIARAAYGLPWPTCRHGVDYRAGCRHQPVPPACCAQEADAEESLP